MEKEKKVGFRNWLVFVIVGLVGQLAWSLENMYLNSFLFSLGYENYQQMITLTVALSAVTACLTTLIIGGLTDKVGRRKIFICLGYLLWGLSTAAFGLINSDNVKLIFPVAEVAKLSSIFVIVLDCVMTFFGSSANDAAFNSYVTKNVAKNNRGKVEGVLSILPLMSMLAITVIFGIFVNDTKQEWDKFFYIIGGAVFLVGLISIFLVPNDKGEKSDENYISILFEGFKPRVIKENKLLYIILLIDFIYCAASQIFFPYMIIYFQEVLQIKDLNFMIFMGVVLVVGSLLAVIAGIILDKVNKYKSLIIFSLIYIAGLVGIYFINGKDGLSSIGFIICIVVSIIMMFGYISLSTAINALIRDNTPKGKEGAFQGVRMIFQVALPMISGPILAEYIVTNYSTSEYINEYGTIQKLPPNLIWLVAACALVIIFIPVIISIVMSKKRSIENRGILYGRKN